MNNMLQMKVEYDFFYFKCQIGVLPFGTGNDLARVLGWGAAFDDDTQLPTVLEKLEHSQIKMLDRFVLIFICTFL